MKEVSVLSSRGLYYLCIMEMHLIYLDALLLSIHILFIIGNGNISFQWYA